MAKVFESVSNKWSQVIGTRADDQSLQHGPEEDKMEKLPQVLFWLGIIAVPFAWLIWYLGPEIEFIRPVLDGIQDPALRAAMQEAHAERLGIWVGVWPVSLLVLSHILEKKIQ